VNMLRAVIVVAWLVGASGLGEVTSCCRPVGQPIRYEYHPEWHGEAPEDCSVLQVLATSKGRTSIGVFCDGSYFFSADDGLTWNRRNAIPTTISTYDLIRAPSDPRVLYRRSTGRDGRGFYYFSGNAGNTWVKPKYCLESGSSDCGRARGEASLDFRLQAIDPTNPNRIYARVAALKVDPDRTIYRRELPGVYTSDDRGNSWKLFSVDIGSTADAPFPQQESVIGISPKDSNEMFGRGARGLLKSADGGRTWSPLEQNKLLLSRPLYSSESTDNRLLGAPNTIEVYEFAFDTVDSHVVYIVSNKGIYRSADGGISWCLLDLGVDEIADVNNAVPDPRQPGELVVGTKRGLFRSTRNGCEFKRVPVRVSLRHSQQIRQETRGRQFGHRE
jgi:hypothetical protein